jgi:hypothetical protein
VHTVVGHREGYVTREGPFCRGKDVAFLAGELADEPGQIVAVATATAQIRAMAVGRPTTDRR